MRGYLFAEENKKKQYLETFVDANWQNDLDLTNEENITKLLNNLIINNNQFFDGITNDKIKNELKDITNEAFKKEIFGAPTFVVNKKIFWGQDRLKYALEVLNNN